VVEVGAGAGGFALCIEAAVTLGSDRLETMLAGWGSEWMTWQLANVGRRSAERGVILMMLYVEA